MSQYSNSRDPKHSSSYRGHQHHKQPYNSSSSYHNRPYNNSSSYYNSSYKQSNASNRPYSKDQYQQPYNNGRDKYGHYDKESRVDKQSSGYGSGKHGGRGDEYGQKDKYEDKSYKDSTGQRQQESRNIESHPSRQKRSKSHERSRSRNKQYNDKKVDRDYSKYSSKDQNRYETGHNTYNSTYQKPYYNDTKTYETKSYNQKGYQIQDKYKSKDFQKGSHIEKGLTGSSYRQNSFRENRSFKQTNKDTPESKEFVAIEVKSGHRSPRKDKEQKSRKDRNSSVSKSKSGSRSKKSKSKRRHNRKQNSSQSSSNSSSNSSSSSSSKRSSSSSSSDSSSSSESRSVSSRSRKYYKKDSKDFYQKKDQYPKHGLYQSSYNSSAYQRDRPFSQQQKPYVSSYSSSHQQRENQYEIKKPEANEKHAQIRVDIQPQKQKNINIIESQVSISESNRESKPISLNKDDLSQPFNNRPQIPYNEQRQPYNKDFQRDFYKKPYIPNYQPRGPYYQNKPYFNPYYQNNQVNNQVSNPQTSTEQVSVEIKTNQANESMQQSYPTYQSNGMKSAYVNESNEFRRQYSAGFQNNERRPYSNSYHQSYSNQVNMNQSYQPSNASGYPYQHRFHQPYIPNRPYQRTYSNQPTQNQPETFQSNLNSTYQNQSFVEQKSYQPSFPGQFRRTFSQNFGQRKPSYSFQGNDNDMTKTHFAKAEEKEDFALLQQTLKREADLKKINSLIPCSKVLDLVEKARQNLTVPAIKSGFLTLEVYKEMSNFKKQTMNPNLKNVLESDFKKKYDEEKKIVFENLKILNIGESQVQEYKENNKINYSDPQKTQKKDQKMEAQEDNLNPQNKKWKQFLWKKPEMSENLRVLKSNLEMMRKASTCLSEISRKMKMKFQETPIVGEKTQENQLLKI